jgi:DNA-directed RNA polymerase specialized sigma24 family protein
MPNAPLPTTRVTVLRRLAKDPTEQAAWDEFVDRYDPQIYRWCWQWKMQDAGAEEVMQDIRLIVAAKSPFAS